jgi:hypothetical protein
MNETLIIASTHLAERDDEQKPGGIRLIPAMQNIEGNLLPSVNCWEFGHNEDGTFTLWSYAPIDAHYQSSFPATSYPHIIFDEKNARELLAYLQSHLQEQGEAQ